MPDLRSLSTGMQVALGASVLLLIDTFLSWQSVDVGPFEVSQNGWHGFWGVVLGLLTIAMIAWLAARLFGVKLPELPVPERTITLALAALILLFALIKNLADDYSTIWAYIGVVLAAGVAAGAWLLTQEPEPLAASPSTYETPPPAPPPPAAEPPAPPPASAPPTTPPAGTSTADDVSEPPPASTPRPPSPPQGP
jgi:hypothetical protein